VKPRLITSGSGWRMLWYTKSGRLSWGPSTGLLFINVAPNAVNSSGAVSPTARAMPRTMAVVMPLRAVGSTTDHTVRARDAPSARLASRRPSGTSRSTTSMVRVMVGSITMASARLAMKPL
jgi:hypothetical protein